MRKMPLVNKNSEKNIVKKRRTEPKKMLATKNGHQPQILVKKVSSKEDS